MTAAQKEFIINLMGGSQIHQGFLEGQTEDNFPAITGAGPHGTASQELHLAASATATVAFLRPLILDVISTQFLVQRIRL